MQRFVFNVCSRVTIFAAPRVFVVAFYFLVALRLPVCDTVVAEHFLCVRADLRGDAGAHVLGDFLPVLVVELDG